MNASAAPGFQVAQRPVAPVWHTIVFLLVYAALTVLGWRVSTRTPASAAAPPRLVTLQIQAIVFEWLTAAWAWFGLSRNKTRLANLIGGRWASPRAVAQDIALGAGLWLLWIAMSRIKAAMAGHAADLVPYPSNALEGVLAVAVAASAGFCEEIVFRGYFQRQFWALTKSAFAAVILQAALFGMPHVYQGIKVATEATMYGLLFGGLALWRRSLRPGMIAHTWSDIAARLLRL